MTSSAEKKTEEQEHRMELVFFCERCFASSDNSSWGEIIDENYCYNCGCGGPSLKIPRYSVTMIRQSASWVGKRYYPADEDIENREERKRLLACVTEFHGRTVEPAWELDREGTKIPQEGRWDVKQLTPGKCHSSTSVTADTEEEAWEKARLCGLTYHTEESISAESPAKS